MKICDLCGEKMWHDDQRIYSTRLNKNIDMCRTCRRRLRAALEQAEADFYKSFEKRKMWTGDGKGRGQ